VTVLNEPKFTIYSPSGANLLSEEKKAMLKAEKENAVNMVKTASFREGLQAPYPSPFLNLSDMNIPEKSSSIFRWCKYYYMFDPLIAGAINSLATFPVTDIYLEDLESKSDKSTEPSEELKFYKNMFFKKLNIHKLLIEIGIDYWLYGNCFIFGEMTTNEKGEKEWKHITRLDASKMIIDVNPATQEKKYKWRIPERIVQIVTTKKPIEEYKKIPELIKEAVKKDKVIVIKNDNIYHFSRPTDSMGDSVWGTPVIANVLKLLMYRNVLRQAQEAIAKEHIVPFRVYYFQQIENYNPNINWDGVAGNFAAELKKAAMDPNYKVVSPVPVNVLNIGGHGRSLLLTPEIEQIQAEILAGMNVPREFIFGGISYSGSSISLKILENHFITYRLLLKDFMQNFIIKKLAMARGEILDDDDEEGMVTVRMADLKMQDDVQQKQLVINLNAAGKLTDEFMWKVIGVDPEKMQLALKKEAMDKVKLENELQLERIKQSVEVQKAQMKAQFELQKYQMELQRQYGIQPGMDSGMEEQQVVQQEVEQPKPQQQEQSQQPQQEQTQSNQQQENPKEEQRELTQLELQKVALDLLRLGNKNQVELVLSRMPVKIRNQVMAMMEHMKPDIMQEAEEQQKQDQGIDMRPLPEQRPPRRKSLQ